MGGITDPLPVEPDVESVASGQGVIFSAPPLDLMPELTKRIDAAFASLPPGAKGGLISTYWQTPDGKKFVNAAVVHKVDDEGPVKSQVGAWIGKSWGERREGWELGVAWRTTWQ